MSTQTKAKITSKGQITVPRAVRIALGVKEGDNLIFEPTENGFRVTPAKARNAFAKYRGIGNPGLAGGREAVVDAAREIRGKASDE